MRDGRVRIAVHVHPGSKQPRVGGVHDQRLIVRVRSRAIDGAATAEVVRSIAVAFGVRATAVDVVRGARSREKVLEVTGDDDAIGVRLRELMARTLDGGLEER